MRMRLSIIDYRLSGGMDWMALAHIPEHMQARCHICNFFFLVSMCRYRTRLMAQGRVELRWGLNISEIRQGCM